MNRRDYLTANAAALIGTGLTGVLGAAGCRHVAAETPSTQAQYLKRDAVDLAAWVASGEVSPLEVLELAIARARAVNPQINAINIPLFEQARNQVRSGLPAGPLRGVPWLLKDLHLQLKGAVTSNGSAFFKDAVAGFNSTLVDRYLKAGLMIFGKTHSPEFGGTTTTESALWGQTRNPWNLSLSSGGSSGGSAAAVAAGILPAANASDGGGSIRIPASYCGLFGMKPTRARTPMGPDRFEGANGQSVIHAVSRSVRDSALLLDISQGPEPGMPYHAPAVTGPYLDEVGRDPKALRIALVTQPMLPIPVHKDCLTAVQDAAQLCQELGHPVEEATLAIPPREYYGAVSVISAVGTLAMVSAREKVLGRPVTEADLEPIIFQRMEKGRSITGLQYANARATYHRMGALLARFHQSYDIILTPTCAAPPPPLGVLSLSTKDYQTYEQGALAASVFTHPYNVSGQPAMSMPLHWNDQGLPIGVMFAAPFGDEATLFRLAGQIEQARPWFSRLPAMA